MFHVNRLPSNYDSLKWSSQLQHILFIYLFFSLLFFFFFFFFWDVPWENVSSGKTQSEDIDKPSHSHSLVSISADRLQNRRISYCSIELQWREHPLRKHAYSNTLKILPPKMTIFQIKKFWHFSYFCTKHRLCALVRTASTAFFIFLHKT